MSWRFLERFKESIKSVLGEHVDLVNNVNFVGRIKRQSAHRFAQSAIFVNAAIGSGVNLVEIARSRAKRVGQNPRHTRLAGAARTSQEIGVRRPAGSHRTLEHPNHRRLTNYFGKSFRAIFSIESDLRHWASIGETGT